MIAGRSQSEFAIGRDIQMRMWDHFIDTIFFQALVELDATKVLTYGFVEA